MLRPEITRITVKPAILININFLVSINIICMSSNYAQYTRTIHSRIGTTNFFVVIMLYLIQSYTVAVFSFLYFTVSGNLRTGFRSLLPQWPFQWNDPSNIRPNLLGRSQPVHIWITYERWPRGNMVSTYRNQGKQCKVCLSTVVVIRVQMVVKRPLEETFPGIIYVERGWEQ